MSVSYKKLWIHLIEKNMKRTDLIKLTGITSNTLANMGKDEYISMKNLEKICRAMNLTPSDILDFVEDQYMKDENALILIDETNITDIIYTIRGKQVMLDSDLASLYQVTTKRLNEQVSRNKNRFPAEFMFRLTK